MQEQQKKQPEISIIVPVYKTERFLSACISSILAQTFTDFELILVDDGSPDSCPALCDAAAAKDSRIRVIHQKNRGLSGARNAGLDAAEGEWIAFVDSDDTITPDFCAKLYHAAQEAGAQMAVCNYRQVDEALTPIRKQYLHVRREVLTPEQALEHSTLLPYMVVWNKLYHRSIFAQLRFAEGKLNEDTLLIAYAYEKADRIANIPDALQKFPEVAGAALLQTVIIHRKALLDIFMQPFRCPAAEAGGNLRLHTVSDGDNHVQIVVVNVSPYLPAALGANQQEFLVSCLRRKLAVLVYPVYMLADVLLRGVVDLRKLLLCDPDIFIGETDRNLRDSVLILVNHHIVIVHEQYLRLFLLCYFPLGCMFFMSVFSILHGYFVRLSVLVVGQIKYKVGQPFLK